MTRSETLLGAGVVGSEVMPCGSVYSLLARGGEEDLQRDDDEIIKSYRGVGERGERGVEEEG
jgi:hypothetical protein